MLVLKLSVTQNLYFYSAYDIVDSYNTFIHIYTHFKFKIDVISFTKGVTIQIFMNIRGIGRRHQNEPLLYFPHPFELRKTQVLT